MYVCTAGERAYAREMWRLLDAGSSPLIPHDTRSARLVSVPPEKGAKTLKSAMGRAFPGSPLAVVVDDRPGVWDDQSQSQILSLPPFCPYACADFPPDGGAGLDAVRVSLGAVRARFFADFFGRFAPAAATAMAAMAARAAGTQPQAMPQAGSDASDDGGGGGGGGGGGAVTGGKALTIPAVPEVSGALRAVLLSSSSGGSGGTLPSNAAGASSSHSRDAALLSPPPPPAGEPVRAYDRPPQMPLPRLRRPGYMATASSWDIASPPCCGVYITSAALTDDACADASVMSAASSFAGLLAHDAPSPASDASEPATTRVTTVSDVTVVSKGGVFHASRPFIFRRKSRDYYNHAPTVAGGPDDPSGMGTIDRNLRPSTLPSVSSGRVARSAAVERAKAASAADDDSPHGVDDASHSVTAGASVRERRIKREQGSLSSLAGATQRNAPPSLLRSSASDVACSMSFSPCGVDVLADSHVRSSDACTVRAAGPETATRSTSTSHCVACDGT